MHRPTVVRSDQDASVNFVFNGPWPGYFEARYVRRVPDYFVAYLSAQSGCKQGCRMCHLTVTGQQGLVNADKSILMEQARAVLKYYDENQPPAKAVHFNFMARGEPLENPLLLAQGYAIVDDLAREAVSRKLVPSYLISTIMPQAVRGQRLIDSFPILHPDFYYSLYSVKEAFRKKWLPRALPVPEALAMLRDYYDATRKVPKIHWAFIEGENDSEDDIRGICEAVNAAGLRVDVNIVQYNPYSETYGREPSPQVTERNVELLARLLPMSEVKYITRIGFDVNASCGMFVRSDFEPKS